MTGFQCNMQGASGNKALGKPQLPRYCGADPAKGKVADPSNCTYGAKSPMWWLQAERNNVSSLTPYVPNSQFNIIFCRSCRCSMMEWMRQRTMIDTISRMAPKPIFSGILQRQPTHLLLRPY